MNNQLFLILFFLFFLTGCETDSERSGDTESRGAGTEKPVQSQPSTLSTENWKTYEGKELGLKFSYPDSWIAIENREKAGNPVVLNLYKKSLKNTPVDQPFHFHESADISYISIWPQGIGTELPSGAQRTFQQRAPQLDYTIPVNEKESRVFYLENGDEWAFLLRPELQNTNANWSEYGFIFAQAATSNFSATCVDADSGQPKPMKECDPLGGDSVKKKGTVNKADRRVIDQIVESMEFTTEFEPAVTDLIKVEKPLPNMDIRSPLNIRGKAKGLWYFEGDFTVVLKDADGKVIAQTIAVAQEDWMTEDFVPFTATIEYDEEDAPDDERGSLEFERANPSGLQKNDRTYSVPVLFPPKDK